MVKLKIRRNFLIAFIVLILAIILAYFMVSIELSNMSTTTTMPTTVPTTTTTIPLNLSKSLLEIADENIKNKCNVTYTYVEKKHFPTSKWFSDICPNFKGYNETELWRTSAYLNGECDLEKEQKCIEILTSISLDKKLICVWAIEHPIGTLLSFQNLTQKYC